MDNPNKVKKILLVRTDRMGELLLTQPAIRAVRNFFPDAKVTLVLAPATLGAVEGSSFLNSLIEFDLKRDYANLASRLKFFWSIRRARFDLVVIFNPSKFFNIVTFLAGIPIRVGYDRKWGFLLTHKIKDKKYLCEKHEVDYNLDLVGAIGVDSDEKELYFPLSDSAEKNVKNLLEANGVKERDLLVAVHPSASNPEKIWPPDRFAEISDRISEKFNAKVILVGSQQEKKAADEIKAKMKKTVLDLTGQLNIKELGSLLKRSLLLISNDSGPVHIAAAVGTCAIVFFGEDRPGGSSKRWGPYGEGHIVIGKPKITDITVEEAYHIISEKVSKACQIP